MRAKEKVLFVLLSLRHVCVEPVCPRLHGKADMCVPTHTCLLIQQCGTHIYIYRDRHTHTDPQLIHQSIALASVSADSLHYEGHERERDTEREIEGARERGSERERDTERERGSERER